MKWMNWTALCLISVSATLCARQGCIGEKVDIEMLLVFFLLLFAFIISFAVGLVYEESRGQPLTARQLKKREIYMLGGKGKFTESNGTIKQVYFVQICNRPVVVVELPIELPEHTTYFCVVQDFDELGQSKKGMGAIVVQRVGAIPTEKISFPWKPKPKDKSQ